jgi:hypothetical protein
LFFRKRLELRGLPQLQAKPSDVFSTVLKFLL